MSCGERPTSVLLLFICFASRVSKWPSSHSPLQVAAVAKKGGGDYVELPDLPKNEIAGSKGRGLVICMHNRIQPENVSYKQNQLIVQYKILHKSRCMLLKIVLL